MIAVLLGVAAEVVGGACLAARAFPSPRPVRDRAVAASVFALILPIAEVRALAMAHAIARGPMLATALGVAAAIALLVGGAARSRAWADAREGWSIARDAWAGGAWALAAWVGLAALALSALAAWLLPPWAWDSLGYHLPIVHDALTTRTMRAVPSSVTYVNAYPRAIETFFVAWRVLLDDDTWIDFAQAPFAVAACVATAAMARRAGASVARAAAYGALFVAVPLVMLQVATDYVDVATAALLVAATYFATGPAEPRELLVWAAAAGLLLDSKPSAPPAVAILGVVVLVRAARNRRLASAVLACVVVLLLGAQKYAANAITYGNPIWPVALRIGPIALPGGADGSDLFVQGLPESLRHAGWLRRVATSLFVEPDRYVYDMRLGGLGPLASLGLVPIALFAGPRLGRRAWPMLLLAACALASPAAHWMRYGLAFAAALLAIASAATEGIARRGSRRAIDVVVAALAAVGIARAMPALTDGGPSLTALLAMPPRARAVAVGVDGHEELWATARDRVKSGEAFAYDASFELPGQLWCGDGRARAVYLGDEVRTADDVARAIDEARVRVLVAGDDLPAAEAVRRDRDRFAALFRCPLDRCTVYEVLDRPAARVAR